MTDWDHLRITAFVISVDIYFAFLGFAFKTTLIRENKLNFSHLVLPCQPPHSGSIEEMMSRYT